MIINIDDLDIDRLRKDLIDYYMSAMFILSPVAVMDLSRVEKATDEEVVRIAIDNRFNIREYSMTGIKKIRYKR